MSNEDHGAAESEAMGSAGQVLRTVMMMAGQLAQIRASVQQRRAQEQERQERETQAELRERENEIKAAEAADLAARKDVKAIKDKALRERDQRIREAERTAAQAERDKAINERTESRRAHEAQRRIAEHHLQRADRDKEFFETATPAEIADRYRQAVEFHNESGIAQTMRTKIEEFAERKGVNLTEVSQEEKSDLAAVLAKAMDPNRPREREDDPTSKQQLAEALIDGADAEDRAAVEQAANTKLEPQELSEIAQAKREEIQAVLNDLAAKRGAPTQKAAAASPRPDRASKILNAARVRASERASVAPYDSADRRAATAQHLEENTTASKDAIEARMGADVTASQPVQVALGAKVRQPAANKSGQVRDLSQKVGARERQEPGR